MKYVREVLNYLVTGMLTCWKYRNVKSPFKCTPIMHQLTKNPLISAILLWSI